MPGFWRPIHRFLRGDPTLAILRETNWKRWLIVTGQAYCGLHVFVNYIGYVKETYGPSMLPTLNTQGDHVYISKLYRRGRGIKYGDIVSIKHPLLPEESASKRVVGLPGDYVLRDTPGSPSKVMIQVPEGHCWLAGDNLTWSRDSRDYGPIPLALIQGKVVARVWPLNQFKMLRSTFEPVESTPRFQVGI